MIIVSQPSKVEFLKEIIEESVYTKNIAEAYLLLFQFLLNSDIKNFPFATAKTEDIDKYTLYLLNNREKYELLDSPLEDILTISLLDLIPQKIINICIVQINGRSYTLQFEYASLIYFNFILDNIKNIINDHMEYQHNIGPFNEFIEKAEKILTQIPIEDFEIMKDYERSGAKKDFMIYNKETISIIIEDKLFLNLDEDRKKEVLNESLDHFNNI